MTSDVQRMSGRLEDGTECVLYVDEDGPRLEVDRDHEHPQDIFGAPDEPERLVMRVTRNQVVTLTGVYRARRNSNFARSFEEYRANIIYIGPAEFTAELDLVKVAIRPSNERLAVMYNGHRIHRRIGSEDATLGAIFAGEKQGDRYYVDVIDMERCKAFTVQTGGLTVSGDISLSTDRDIQGHQTTEYRTVRLAYDKATNMATAIPDLLTTCDFLSLMVGAVISPASIKVTTTGDSDRFGRPPTFDVYASWRAAGDEIDPQKGYQCLAAPLFDVPLYEQAIGAWLARRDEWRTSYALGTICLHHHGEISSRRFLDAAAWFESIPTAIYERQRGRIGKNVIAAAAAAAAAAFQAGGAEVDEGRARALLGSVNAASLKVRIEDAMALVRRLLGPDVLPIHLDALAAVISRIRGRFAHGEDAFASDLGYVVHDATLLLEVLACVLTLNGLGGVHLTPDIGGHPMRRALIELRHFDAQSLI